MEDITEAADVGKGTFFNYFESKDHVLSVMAEIQLGKVREALQEATAGKKPIQSVLRHMYERVAEEPGRSPKLARALLSSFLASDLVRQSLDRNLREGRRMVAEVISIGQKRGEIDPKLKNDQMALQLQQSIMGTLLLWSLHGEPNLQSAVQKTFQHYWRGLASRE